MRDDDDVDEDDYCVALRSRRIWPWLRLWPPAKKSSGASSRDSRYPESLAAASMLTGARLGTDTFSPSITVSRCISYFFHNDVDFKPFHILKREKHVQHWIVHHLFFLGMFVTDFKLFPSERAPIVPSDDIVD